MSGRRAAVVCGLAAALAAAATLTVLERAIAQPAADCDAVCSAGAALIERFDLREGRTPARERDDWVTPRRIAVADLGLAQFIRPLVPGIEVVGVDGLRNFAAMEQAVEGAEILIGLCSPEVIARGRQLRWIQLLNAGADSCTEVPAVAERGLLVTNLQRIQGPHMAEHALALMFALARSLPQYGRDQAAGHWSRGLRGVEELRLVELEGKTLLVVGLGGIGTEVARRAAALGMRVIATRNSRREGPDFVDYVGLAHEVDALAEQADVIVNSTPLTDATRGMFDARFFTHMQPRAWFINIGRGESVVTDDLVEALAEGRLAGAGLDVTDPEPLPPGHPLWQMPNVILTPHIATRSDLRDERTAILVAENLRRYLRGDALVSEVSLTLGY